MHSACALDAVAPALGARAAAAAARSLSLTPRAPTLLSFQEGLARLTIMILAVTSVSCLAYTWGYYEVRSCDLIVCGGARSRAASKCAPTRGSRVLTARHTKQNNKHTKTDPNSKIFPWTPKEPWTAGHETAVAVGPKGLVVGASICYDMVRLLSALWLLSLCV